MSKRIDINLHLNSDAEQTLAEVRADSKKTAKQVAADFAGVNKEVATGPSEEMAKNFKVAHDNAVKTGRVLADEKKSIDQINQSQMQSIKGFVAMGASMLGLQSGHALLNGVVDDLNKSAEYAQKTARELLTIRGTIRELAALRGDMGNTTPTLGHVLGVQAQTLQSTQDVNAMEQAGLGIGELAIGKTMTKEHFEKAMVSTGKMAMMEGGSPDAYGAFAGQIALQSDHELTAEEHQARMDRLFKIQQPGGFRNMGQAIGQFSNINELIQNKILTSEEAMGNLAAFSVSNPGEAGTMSQQFIRATKGSQIKARGMKVDPDLDTEKSFEYMKSIHADKLSSPNDIGDAIAADFKEKEKQYAAQAEKFDAYRELSLHGFGNEQDKRVIMAYTGLKNSGMLDKIRAAQNSPLQIGLPGHGPIDERFREMVNKDPMLQSKQADTLGQLADARKGLEGEPLEIARKAAFNSLKAEGKIRGNYEEWGNPSHALQTMDDTAHMFTRSATENSYSAIEMRTREMLVKEARDLKIKENDATKSMFDFSGVEPVEDMGHLAKRVQAAGGSLSPQVGENLLKASAELREATTNLSKLLKPGGPPAHIQSKPTQVRTRP